MPSSSSQMRQASTSGSGSCSRNSRLMTLLPSRDYLVQRILKKHPLQPVTNMPWRLFTRPRPRLVNIILRTQKPQRQPLKQTFRSLDCKVGRVIRKWPDLVGQAHCSPARMHTSRNRINRMMNVHREIQQAARNEDPRQLMHDSGRRLSMVDDVVTDHDMKALIGK